MIDYARLYSLESEQSVIGALLIDPLSADRIGALKPEHCYHESHRVILGEIIRMIASGKPVDVITVAEELSAHGLDEQTGGLAYLGEMAANTTGSRNIERYAETVINKALERQLLGVSETIRATVTSVGTTKDKLTAAQTAVMSITEAVASRQPKVMREILISAAETLTQRSSGNVRCLPTGFRDLDRQLAGGLRPGNLIVLAGRPGMGKAQPLTSKVLLENGQFVDMGSINVGDMLASVDGAPSQVTGVFPQGVRPIYRVTLTDGRIVEADAEHLWSVESCRFDGVRIVSTTQLMDMLVRVRFRNRLRLSAHNGCFGSDVDLCGIDPWLLGFLLGDGCLTKSGVRFSTAEPYILQRVTEAANGCAIVRLSEYDYSISTQRGQKNPVLDALRNCGVFGKLAHEKSVPDVVMSATRNVRASVLAGLIESDGWVEKTGCVLFASASEVLRDDVVRLVESLGGSATKTVKNNVQYSYRNEIRDGLPSFKTCIKLDDISEIVRSPRLLSNMKARRYPSQPYVSSVEYIREDITQCIKVSHPSSLYLTDGWVVTHNTSLAVNVAYQVARSGSPSLFLSMEMPEQELADRLIAQSGSVFLSAVLAGDMEGDNGDRIMCAVSILENLPLVIDDQGGLTLFDVASKARSVKRKHGLGLLVLDYLQLMSGDGDNRNQQIEQITRGLKALAKELDIPIIALSQLSRKCEERTNKRPMSSDLRESGAIEQDADVILFVYRDEEYNPNSPDKGTAEIIISKNRQGQNGMVRMSYQGCFTRFNDLDPGWQPEYREEQKKPRRGMD